MLFSYKQYEQTKAELFQQFQKQPIVQSKDQSFILYQFNKLLNKIRFQKIKQKVSKTSFNNSHNNQASDQLTLKKCVTGRKIIKLQTVDTHRKIEIEKKKEFVKKSQKIKIKQAQKQKIQDFYLTSFRQSADNQKIIQSIFLDNLPVENNQFKINNFIAQQNRKQNSHQQSIDSSVQTLVALKVKNFELENEKQYLHTQIQQLQHSIRYFQSLNLECQKQLAEDERKSVNATNLVIKNHSNLNAATMKNRYVKQKIQQIQRLFYKELKQKKIKRNFQAKKCSQFVDEAAQKILTLKYLKQKIQQQKCQIQKLDQKSKYKKKRIEQSKKVENYAKILLKTSYLTNFLKWTPYGNLIQLQSVINSIQQQSLCPAVQPFSDNIDNCLKDQLQLTKSNQVDYYELARQILKVFLKLTYDEEKLQKLYEEKVAELEKDNKFYHQNLLKFDRNLSDQKCKGILSSLQSRPHQLTSSSLRQTKQKNQIGYDVEYKKSLLNFIQEQKNQERKNINRSQTMLLIQERVQFLIKKLIRYFQYIVQKWLKFDQSAIQFLLKITSRISQIKPIQIQYLSYSDSKSVLISHFQQWKQYIFFIDQIHNNPLVKKYVSKQKLQHILKIAIKTKEKFPKVRTEKILIKSYGKLYQESMDKSNQNIQSLVRLGAEIIQYFERYQVVIVNSVKQLSLSYKNQGFQQQKSKYVETSKNFLNGRDSEIAGVDIDAKKTRNIGNTRFIKQSNEIYQSQKSEASLLTQKQIEKKQPQQLKINKEDPELILNLILDYKEEIKKIQKLSFA